MQERKKNKDNIHGYRAFKILAPNKTSDEIVFSKPPPQIGVGLI